MNYTGLPVTKTEFDDKVSEILSRPEYVHLNNGIKDFIENIRERISKWLENFLDNAFPDMSDVPSISNGLSTVFLILGILVIAAIIIFIAAKAGKTFEKNKKIREILGERIDGKVTTTSLRNKAMEHEREGEYRLAIRYGYIALLLLMHEKDILFLEETKTNQEILQSLKKTGFTLLPVFEQLAGTFNASWYGHKAYSKDSYSSWNDSVNLVWSKVSVNEEKI